MDLLKSSGNFPSSQILLMISVSFSTPYSSKASIISMTTPSGPAALFFLIILIAVLTSDLRILGPSIKSQKLGSSTYSAHLFRIVSFSTSIVPSFALIQPDPIHPDFLPEISLILLYTLCVVTKLILYFSTLIIQPVLLCHSTFLLDLFVLLSVSTALPVT